MNIADTQDTRREQIVAYIQGEPVEPGGHFLISHSGSKPMLVGDRAGMVQVGIALLRYAIEAVPEPQGSEIRGRSIGDIFSPTSKAQTLVLFLDEEIGSRPPPPSPIRGMVDIAFQGVRKWFGSSR